MVFIYFVCRTNDNAYIWLTNGIHSCVWTSICPLLIYCMCSGFNEDHVCGNSS